MLVVTASEVVAEVTGLIHNQHDGGQPFRFQFFINTFRQIRSSKLDRNLINIKFLHFRSLEVYIRQIVIPFKSASGKKLKILLILLRPGWNCILVMLKIKLISSWMSMLSKGLKNYNSAQVYNIKCLSFSELTCLNFVYDSPSVTANGSVSTSLPNVLVNTGLITSSSERNI